MVQLLGIAKLFLKWQIHLSLLVKRNSSSASCSNETSRGLLCFGFVQEKSWDDCSKGRKELQVRCGSWLWRKNQFSSGATAPCNASASLVKMVDGILFCLQGSIGSLGFSADFVIACGMVHKLEQPRSLSLPRVSVQLPKSTGHGQTVFRDVFQVCETRLQRRRSIICPFLVLQIQVFLGLCCKIYQK